MIKLILPTLIEAMSDVQRQAGDGSSTKAQAADGESTPWKPTTRAVQEFILSKLILNFLAESNHKISYC